LGVDIFFLNFEFEFGEISGSFRMNLDETGLIFFLNFNFLSFFSSFSSIFLHILIFLYFLKFVIRFFKFPSFF
jgi:hypothetical protein